MTLLGWFLPLHLQIRPGSNLRRGALTASVVPRQWPLLVGVTFSWDRTLLGGECHLALTVKWGAEAK